MSKKQIYSVGYRADIDILRALAVTIVIGFHSFTDFFSSGYLGVDVFFVISSFLITKILIKRFEKKNIFRQLFNFWSSRIRRLFPALLTVLSISLIIGYLSFFTEELEILSLHAWRSLVYWQNFTLISEIGYFDAESIKKPLLHLWSLSVEEHFYIIWPFIILLGLSLSGLKNYALPIIMAMIFFSSFFYSFYLNQEDTQIAFYHSLARFWEMALGGMVALLVCQKHDKIWGIISLMLLIACLMVPEGIFSLLVHQIITCVLTATTIWLGFSMNNMSPFVWLGKISYPLYLWHWIIFSFANIIFKIQLGSLAITALLILISLLLAALTYQTVERLRYAKIGFLVCITWGITLFCIAFFFHKNVGLPNRPHLVYQQDYNLQQVRHKVKDEACLNLVKDPKFHYCRYDDHGFDKTIAIIGDSHAHVLFPGMTNIAKSYGFNTLMLANSSCPPLPGFKWHTAKVSIEMCQNQILQIYETLKENSKISKVVITSRGPVYIHGEPERPFTEKTIVDSLEKFRFPELLTYETYGAGLTAAIETLTKLQKFDIFYLLENPELDFDPKDALPRPFVKTHNMFVSRQLYDLRMQKYNNTVRGAIGNQITVLDPRDALCNRSECRFFDRRLLYADDDHFSVYGSYQIIKHFEDQIFEKP